MISFTVQAPDFERVRERLGHIPGAAEKAMSRALNRAINSAKTEAIRRVEERYEIGSSDLRKSLKVIGATSQRLRAKLVATSAFYPISKFNVRESGGKVITEVIRSRSKPWVTAFLATVTGMYGGKHLGVFVRNGKFKNPKEGRYAGCVSSRNGRRSAKGERIKREEIEEKFSVSSEEMVGHHEIVQAVMHLAEGKVRDELDRQIELFLSGKAV
jgi:hypothetical protein